jgi:hypothetical protein
VVVCVGNAVLAEYFAPKAIMGTEGNASCVTEMKETLQSLRGVFQRLDLQFE